MLAVPMLCSCDRSELENWARHVRKSFASKLGRQRGMRSVPPRGSGWVQPVAFENLANSHADHQPTRYCVVVLTSRRVDDRLLRQSRPQTQIDSSQNLYVDVGASIRLACMV